MKRHTTRIIAGTGIALLGAALLLANLNILNFSDIISTWWPLFIVGAGILMFINDPKNYIWASLAVIIGLLLQLQELDVLDINPWQLFWPMVIIAVGISVIFSRPGTGKLASTSEREDTTAILGGSDHKNTSSNYKGGKVTAIMGGTKIDLRRATIHDQATIEVFSLWGGIEIIVPRNVIVKNQTNAILGGIEDKTDQDEVSKKSPVLYITGDVIMAGVEIKN